MLSTTTLSVDIPVGGTFSEGSGVPHRDSSFVTADESSSTFELLLLEVVSLGVSETWLLSNGGGSE